MLRSSSRLAAARILVLCVGFFLFSLTLTNFRQGNYLNILLFSLAIISVDFLLIAFPRGGHVAPSSSIILASLFILPFPFALASTFIGTLVSRLIKSKKKDYLKIAVLISRKIIVITCCWLISRIVGGTVNSFNSIWIIVPYIMSSFTFFLLDVALSQLFFSFEKGVSFTSIYMGSVRIFFPIYVTFTIISFLMVLLFTRLSFWSVILFALPLMVATNSFRLLLSVRKTYQDTIGALSGIIEAQDPVRKGHAQRVTELSVNIGRELGIYGRELERLGYAASLHDIGELGFVEKENEKDFDGSDLEDGVPFHAHVGADIISHVDYLKDSADLIRYHHHPFMALGSQKIRPLGSRIIAIASKFDELTHLRAIGERMKFRQAIDFLKEDKGLLYDPRVVKAFCSVLRRQGKLV